MSQKWFELQRRLQQLNARIRIVVSQHPSQLPIGEVEILSDTTSPFGSSTTDYFSRLQKPSAAEMRKSMPHRASVSSVISGFSGSSAASMQRRAMDSQRSDILTPESAVKVPPLRKRQSIVSNISSSTVRTSERGTPPVPARPLPDPEMRTPTVRRFTGAGPRSGAWSPSPNATSAAPSTSRLPVASPKGRSPWHLAVPNSAPRPSMFPDPSNWPKPNYGSYSGYGRVPSGTPSLGARSVSGSMPRPSRGAAPPSSFRSTTPTPAGRSSSRLSMGSRAESALAPPMLQPFQPSKVDLLDQNVQAVIEETGFKLFVARVDSSMKRGQRRGDNEEWKGEFVFGAGQRVSPVKLLKIAGRPGRFGMTQGEARMKCMVKARGAWQDLSTLLSQRQQAEAGDARDSP